MLTVWRNFFGQSSEPLKMPTFLRKTHALYALCDGHVSYDLIFKNICFALLFECEIYGHAWGVSLSPVPFPAKENKRKHFPF